MRLIDSLLSPMVVSSIASVHMSDQSLGISSGKKISALTENHVKEALSRSYVSAVAAKAGVVIERPEFDYGIDGAFRLLTVRKGNRIPTGLSIAYQLKATTRFHPTEKGIGYDLDERTYDLLCHNHASGKAPMILLVHLLPKDPGEWLSVDDERLKLRRSCYWHNLGDDCGTDKISSKRIYLNRDRLFTPEALLDILSRNEKNVSLG